MDIAPSYTDLLSKVQELNKDLAEKDFKAKSLQRELTENKNKSVEEAKKVKKIVRNTIQIVKPEPTFQIPFGDYNATLIGGTWNYEPISKAIQLNKITANSKYKDPVQFKIMEQYEEKAEEDYKKQLGKMTVEIIKFLKSI